MRTETIQTKDLKTGMKILSGTVAQVSHGEQYTTIKSVNGKRVTRERRFRRDYPVITIITEEG